MRIIVQKYGGSSLAEPALIKKVAERVIQTKAQGFAPVVVVSALGKTTDQLVNLADQISSSPPRREMDMLLSVGERISISLLAMALSERGYPAISFTGSQVGIITNTAHTRARILEIRCERILHELQHDRIVVVAGFQGVSVDKEITTLGRGGSDTTAIALAAALHAEKCEIMTDVDGVYTANPKHVPDAFKLDELSYDEMLDMADLGSQVLQPAAIEFAKRHDIKIHVGSSFTGEIGTIITDECLDRKRVTGLAVDEDISLVRFKSRDKSAQMMTITGLSENGIAAKFIWDSEQECNLLVKNEDLEITLRTVSDTNIRPRNSISSRSDVGLLSIIGNGIGFGSEVMSSVLHILREIDLAPEFLHGCENRLSFVIDKSHLREATYRLHNAVLARETDAASATGNSREKKGSRLMKG